ncbi:MAG: chemotaxis protein [Magnetospirillum sp.]|nr:MAG: chemotaxis protein [Magnetospirillum sp.]
MTLIRVLILAAVVAVGGLSPAMATEKPTMNDVKAITLKAAALLAGDGVDKTRETFHAEGEFRKGEIYVNVIDLNGTWLIYPPNPKNEGKSVLNVKDAGGKLLVQEIIKVAKEQGEGWVEYHWLNPASNKIEPKLSYVKMVPEHGIITYVGLYK